MTASTVKSENVTNIEASPITALDRKRGRIKTIIDQDTLPTTQLDEAGDLALFGPIPSNAVILDVLVLSDDLDSNCTPELTIDAGLYYSGIGGNQAASGNTSGTVVDADCFATAATTLQAAKTTWTSIRNEADDIVDIKKEAWSVAGLTADPGGLLYVGIAVETAAGTAAEGDLVVRVDYI